MTSCQRIEILFDAAYLILFITTIVLGVECVKKSFNELKQKKEKTKVPPNE